VFSYFQKNPPKSNIKNLLNYKGFPELIQHSRTGTELFGQNSEIYYHISDNHQGYDAFSFYMDDLDEIRYERNLNLMTLYENKMVSFGSVTLDKIMEFFKKYSVPNVEGLELYKGARPNFIDFLEVGTFFPEDYATLLKLNLSMLEKPSIIIKDHSDAYDNLEWNPARGCVQHGTSITDLEFERLKYFSNSLNNQEEIFLIVAKLLEENPLFPL